MRSVSGPLFGRAQLVVVGIMVPAFCLNPPQARAQQQPESVGQILQRFVDDYARDPSLQASITFGVFVGEEKWHVTTHPAEGALPASARLINGEPPVPSFYFILDRDTLVQIDRGELNAETAMAQERTGDATPLRTGSMPGFQPTPSTVPDMLRLMFHFWTRGSPEIVPFRRELSRQVHGARAVILAYYPGFRSAWVSLGKGDHANADPRLQTNPFPSMLIIIRGAGRGRIGERELELGAGNAVFIPPGVEHEFWNPYDEPVEAILVMFGEGA